MERAWRVVQDAISPPVIASARSKPGPVAIVPVSYAVVPPVATASIIDWIAASLQLLAMTGG
jgi:hypothetical protein